MRLHSVYGRKKLVLKPDLHLHHSTDGMYDKQSRPIYDGAC
jgi:hypothetical protein